MCADSSRSCVFIKYLICTNVQGSQKCLFCNLHCPAILATQKRWQLYKHAVCERHPLCQRCSFFALHLNFWDNWILNFQTLSNIWEKVLKEFIAGSILCYPSCGPDITFPWYWKMFLFFCTLLLWYSCNHTTPSVDRNANQLFRDHLRSASIVWRGEYWTQSLFSSVMREGIAVSFIFQSPPKKHRFADTHLPLILFAPIFS